ncbi:hypothetical protein GTR02_12970 [Kineococcus sp. R8]|uniref:hypothetical protein n=1 Tax=Kineococcus siccus TaxID=2696567 RepID=UPI0014131C8D|nr:hypothetical protein [Kineococcus siccus]NAZ82733.1 hypothetical protein [Kineococcus siccus]
MTGLVVLAVLLLVALLAPRFGADTRWEGADRRPDRSARATSRARPRPRTAATGHRARRLHGV